LDALPLHIQARSEFEYVGAKPLGTGFTGVPMKEFRFALLRPFADERMSLAMNLFIASGYTGQTQRLSHYRTSPLRLSGLQQ